MIVAIAAMAVAAASARADDWAPNLTMSATWNDNATNANLSSDRISAVQTRADVLASQRFVVGRDDTILPALHAAAEWWPRYQNLFGGAIGARVEWQHKFGLGAQAPVLSLGGGADVVAAQEAGRRGTTAVATLALRKRFNDLWRGAVTHEWSQHNARYGVFDRTGNETTIELGRDVTDVARFTFGLSYRSGDVLSYATPPRPDLVAIARERLDVDTFDRPMVAYSVDASTFGAKLGFLRAIDDYTAIVASYEYRTTDKTPLRYVNHLVSLGVVHQF